MKKIPLREVSDNDEDDEISSYTKNTGMGAVGLADGRHIKFGDSDEEEEDDEQVEDSDGEEDSDYDPSRDSQPETDDEQAEQSEEQAEQSEEQAEQSEDDDSTDEFIKNVDKMFNDCCCGEYHMHNNSDSKTITFPHNNSHYTIIKNTKQIYINFTFPFRS